MLASTATETDGDDPQEERHPSALARHGLSLGPRLAPNPHPAPNLDSVEV